MGRVADDAPPADELTTDARRRRLELIRAHQRLSDLDEIDAAQVDVVIELTEDLLEREAAAALAHDVAARAVSRRIVLRHVAVLAAVGAVGLVVALATGAGTWGVVLAGAALAAAVVAGVAHVAGPPAGHRSRRAGSVAVLVAGVAAVAMVPAWPPWWLRLLALLVLAGTVLWFLTGFGWSAARDGR